jgi:hypothetical protein
MRVYRLVESPRSPASLQLLFFVAIMASAMENGADRAKMQDERRSNESSMRDVEKKPVMLSGGAKQIFRPRIIAMACIVSMGGFSKSTSITREPVANKSDSLWI